MAGKCKPQSLKPWKTARPQERSTSLSPARADPREDGGVRVATPTCMPPPATGRSSRRYLLSQGTKRSVASPLWVPASQT